jgi:hypothetical protein
MASTIDPPAFSIVVPAGPGEKSWTGLLADLSTVAVGNEVLVVGCEPEPAEFRSAAALLTARWLQAPAGRGRQLNAGAAATSGKYLLFLHADSRLGANAWRALSEHCDIAESKILCFRLRFDETGGRLVRINEWGANARTIILGLPFGDQGFCVSRELYSRIGPFPESAPYGEDHLFVWRARRLGIKPHVLGASLTTSARAYEGRWLKTTYEHLVGTYTQVAKELLKGRAR